MDNSFSLLYDKNVFAWMDPKVLVKILNLKFYFFDTDLVLTLFSRVVGVIISTLKSLSETSCLGPVSGDDQSSISSSFK